MKRSKPANPIVDRTTKKPRPVLPEPPPPGSLPPQTKEKPPRDTRESPAPNPGSKPPA
jgi:hypothetical protein